LKKGFDFDLDLFNAGLREQGNLFTSEASWFLRKINVDSFL